MWVKHALPTPNDLESPHNILKSYKNKYLNYQLHPGHAIVISQMLFEIAIFFFKVWRSALL